MRACMCACVRACVCVSVCVCAEHIIYASINAPVTLLHFLSVGNVVNNCKVLCTLS